MIVLSIEEFAAKRRGDQDSLETDLFPFVQTAMDAHPVEGWYNDLLTEVARQYLRVFRDEGGRPPVQPTAAEFTDSLKPTLDKTSDPDHNTVERVSVWLATAILNAATQAAAATDEEFLVMEWVTMHDKDVREAHQDVEGQQRPPGEPYEVAGVPMLYPGDPSAPIELWINCRCTLAPLLAKDATFTKQGVTMTTTNSTSGGSMTITFNGDPATVEAETEEQVIPGPLPWHGVLAPEGVWSGDGRRFADGALRFRDLPIPLTWQKTTDQGHDGSVVVGKIESIERVDGMMNASGTFLSTPEADEVVGLIAEFGRFGVSVDADDAEFELGEGAEDGKVTFTSARIASASVVSIPAFAEAFVALGPWESEGEMDDEDVCDEESPAYDPEACAKKKEAAPEERFKDYTPKQRKKAHTVPGTDSYPIEDCEDLRNAIQAIGRAKDPAATKKHIKTQKARLGCPDVDIPEGWAEDTEEFVDPKSWWDERGKGWLTHPKETKRIHDYWTRPGEEGYAKIGWGAPGDFNRCRVLVGEKIAKNSPEDARFLNEICAQWHHDALGIWPGQHHSMDREGDPAPAVSLVAAGGPKAPAGWFADPQLPGPTHLTVTEEGRVFGHLAEWETCHIGFDGVCVAPPTSASGYAYFATGRVLLDDGSVARTGVISLGGGHAGHRLRPQVAVEHYDATSAAVADVCIGEDDHGIWCAGWIRPGTTEEQIVALRASDISGDWREVRSGQMELVAALACNVGGFPVVSVGVEGGRQTSLVAAGAIHDPDGDVLEVLAASVEKAIADRKHRRHRMRLLRDRVEGK
jgi:hypothetical protein